ncbi:hypothetical protein GPECTOR_39g469 [Gonium pectorale]|uniref:Uncharacterized protein n=1 Tax=Gonium pectorale TaxID=33097 RepID=A0A150GBP0_GONPE|nr:hypothetical protein GPECTOR_39g469 [Gonium pectorale]|eukprot:KXZ46975.1 hypothetical protein GPECTOR_39g469 [Gonium pectorale]
MLNGAATPGSQDTVLPVLLLYYDFAVARFDDAVATVEPGALESKHDVPLKLYRKLTMERPSLMMRSISTGMDAENGTSGAGGSRDRAASVRNVK